MEVRVLSWAPAHSQVLTCHKVLSIEGASTALTGTQGWYTWCSAWLVLRGDADRWVHVNVELEADAIWGADLVVLPLGLIVGEAP